MRNLPNIEKSGFHRGEYVGYADGVWHIRKVGGRWNAIKRDGCSSFTRDTLEQVSQALEATSAFLLKHNESH